MKYHISNTKATLLALALLLMPLLFSMTSCSDWLDVSPRSEVKADDQFETEQGFMDALYGIYTKLTANALYGNYLTMGVLSVMSYDYTNYSSLFSEAAQYNYEGSTLHGQTDAVWSNIYNVIAEINLVLEHIDGKQAMFSGDNYSIIRGELLGLRGFLHLDILRLYAPSFAVADSIDAKPRLPYRETFDVVAKPALTMREFATCIERDLDEAQQLLSVYKDIDQLNSYITTGDDATDDFLMYRQNRFNYYACLATQARLYLWVGDKEKAAEAAREVIDSGKFHFITTSEANATGASLDRVFTPELIFSLYDEKLKDRADSYFTDLTNNVLTERLSIVRLWLTVYYETDAGGSSDIRYNKWFTQLDSHYYCQKYVQLETMSRALRNQIPLIRLGEMYLIMAEATGAPSYINQLQSARYIQAKTTYDNLDQEVLSETRKEFHAEGQEFFYYKRHNVRQLRVTRTTPEYVWPLPDDEILYGSY